MKYSKILKIICEGHFGVYGYGFAPSAYAIPHASQPALAINTYDNAGQIYPIAEPYTDNHKEVAAEPNVNA